MVAKQASGWLGSGFEMALTTDEKFMKRCLELAAQGEGKVSPNPLVGAVLVKGGKTISEGFHEKFGAAHAEVNCLRGVDASGCTLYVSLEPCSHEGAGKKTPPCVPLIIKSGVTRVVVAAIDQNPHVSGRGISQLVDSGINVKTGVLAAEAERQNEAFNKFVATGKPFVCIKMAQTAQGAIGMRGKGNVKVSGEEFDAYAQRLRNKYDGILVGIGTVLADNPRLTCRLPGGRNPARIVLDSSLQTPLSYNIMMNAKQEKVVIACSENYDSRKRLALERLGAKVIVCGKDKPSLSILMNTLPKLGIHSVLIEGGAQVASDAIAKRLADKAVVAICEKRLNGDIVPSPFTAAVLGKLKDKVKMKMGKDAVVEGYF